MKGGVTWVPSRGRGNLVKALRRLRRSQNTAIWARAGVYRKVAQKYTKNESLLRRWSMIHQWVSRAKAWEDEQDRVGREALLKGVTAMRKAHVDIASQMLVKAARALSEIPTEEMTMQDVVRAVDVATKLERISRGEVTERTDGRTEISGGLVVADDPYAGLTTEELREYIRYARSN